MNNKDIVSSVIKHVDSPLEYRLVSKLWNNCIIFDARWKLKTDIIKQKIGSFLKNDYFIKSWEQGSLFHIYARYSLKNILPTDMKIMSSLRSNKPMFAAMCAVNLRKRKRKETYWIDRDCIYKRDENVCINFTPNVFIKKYIKVIK